MRWSPGSRSHNLEDRRGQGTAGGGGGGGLPIWLIFRIFGFRGGLIVLLLLGGFYYFGGGSLLSGGSQRYAASSGDSADRGPEEEALVDFISFVLDDTQTVWRGAFAERGLRYRDAKLVLFTDAVRSGCGYAGAQTGPFYCPADEKAYIDLGFYRELAGRFDAPGDFAQAYVLAHEIGHHLQTVLEISPKMRAAQARQPERKNELSVLLELQADCFAGVWAHSTAKRDLLEVGDLAEGLRAAAAVGDDRLQRQATGTVTPETWTHGSSAQRQKWFEIGFEQGELEACDTFKAAGTPL